MDPRASARLESNVGNIYTARIDSRNRSPHYERAYTQLMPYRTPKGLPSSQQHGRLLDPSERFPRALAHYQGARFFCQQEQDAPSRGAGDYNIAYLYYLRGEYSRAIEALMLLGAPAKPPVMLITLRCAIWISPTIYLELI